MWKFVQHLWPAVEQLQFLKTEQMCKSSWLPRKLHHNTKWAIIANRGFVMNHCFNLL